MGAGVDENKDTHSREDAGVCDTGGERALRFEVGQLVEATRGPTYLPRTSTPRVWHRGNVVQARWRMGEHYEIQFSDTGMVWVTGDRVRECTLGRGRRPLLSG